MSTNAPTRRQSPIAALGIGHNIRRPCFYFVRSRAVVALCCNPIQSCKARAFSSTSLLRYSRDSFKRVLRLFSPFNVRFFSYTSYIQSADQVDVKLKKPQQLSLFFKSIKKIILDNK